MASGLPSRDEHCRLRLGVRQPGGLPDYTYASWRACDEGVYTWFNTVQRNGTYVAGDLWGCVGVWFSGRWYVNNDAYLNQVGDSVRWHYDNKTWLTTSFING